MPTVIRRRNLRKTTLLTPDSITFDFFAVAAIAAVLILISKTTPGFQEQLVLNYDNPSLHAFYTTHFVHESIAHLRGNHTNYLIVVPLTYLVCLRAGRRREFRLGFLAILFILLPILSLVSYVSLDLVIETIFGFNPDVQSSRGFSSLDGALVGMLMVAVAVLFRDLAEVLAAQKADCTLEAVPRNAAKSMYVSLIQTHLPQLDAVEALDYNEKRKTIGRKSTVDTFAELLDVGGNCSTAPGRKYDGH